ncbi:enolase C-terminal domain-like protein [Sphingosinicella microcystinivorans]|uniref:Mandelate racemase n=1 Tax=Sphingosinicella microcystinivorans TaxID=335406 RepID=A0AAD1D3R0_SPHMI|nr:enolase C-terminal domain-like protein [Sphingosinicella microcystinivorans]RKS85418.1 mandelate racemase [Sphingosinicella microcystinivorans]BBE33292.1 mandelate racemase [Sphingosinicella microcystinivorans]
MDVAPPSVTARALDLRYCEVPLRRPIRTANGTVAEAGLLLFDLRTDEGVTGQSYIFCYRRSAAAGIMAIAHDAAGICAGRALEPQAASALVARSFILIGLTGLVRMALSGLDMAIWDASAKLAGQSLARLIGAGPRRLRSYNSAGLCIASVDTVGEEARELTQSFAGVKVRLGYASAEEDLEIVSAIRNALPAGAAILADYNQALDLPEALKRCHILDQSGLAWIEEPLPHADWASYVRLARTFATPIQLGENLHDGIELRAGLEAGWKGPIMLDAARIGGVTGWLHATKNLPPTTRVSSHLFPEVSAHLLAVTPGADWHEHIDWAAPLLHEPLTAEAGHVIAPDRPGIGLLWDQAAVARYRVH